MTKRFLSVLSAASLAAILAPLPVTAGETEINCRVPFEFSVHGKTMRPGLYTVSTQAGALVVRGREDRAIVLGKPTRSEADTSTRLVFEKFQDTYLLREVWTGGISGRELPLSRTERDRRSNARNGEVERIVITGM